MDKGHAPIKAAAALIQPILDNYFQPKEALPNDDQGLRCSHDTLENKAPQQPDPLEMNSPSPPSSRSTRKIIVTGIIGTFIGVLFGVFTQKHDNSG